MTDDPFLPKDPEQLRQAQPSAQPAPYQPPEPPAFPASAQLASTASAQPAYPQATPGYRPPPPMPYYPGQTKPKTWMNWVAFGCGLGSIVTCGLSGVAGIVFGHLGLSAANRGEADAKGAGIAGLVLGYLSAIALIAYIFIYAAMIGSSGFY